MTVSGRWWWSKLDLVRNVFASFDWYTHLKLHQHEKCLESQNSHEKECKSLKRCQYVCVREMELTDAQPSDISFNPLPLGGVIWPHEIGVDVSLSLEGVCESFYPFLVSTWADLSDKVKIKRRFPIFLFFLTSFLFISWPKKYQIADFVNLRKHHWS